MRAITLNTQMRGHAKPKLITHACQQVMVFGGGHYVRTLCTGRHYDRRASVNVVSSEPVNCSRCRGSKDFMKWKAEGE